MYHVVFALVVLHTLDGREVNINVEEITSLQCKLPGVENKLYTEGVNAIVSLTDGKTISVQETCGEIRDLLPKMK